MNEQFGIALHVVPGVANSNVHVRLSAPKTSPDALQKEMGLPVVPEKILRTRDIRVCKVAVESRELRTRGVEYQMIFHADNVFVVKLRVKHKENV